MTILLFLLGCKGSDIDSAVCPSLGDIDGPGTDTGNIPDMYGNWTTTFGSRAFYNDCNVTNFSFDAMEWINGAAMEVGGRLPDRLEATFTLNEGVFQGMVSDYGGVTFAGKTTVRALDVYVRFGGLPFVNNDGRSEIDGFAFMGLDEDGDGTIDCGMRGDFNARKSGAN